MRVPAPWQAARALRAEVRWAPAPALLQDPLGGPGHLTTVQTHGTVPSKPCHEHTGKTRCTFPYITLPEAHADIGATPATVIRYFKDRSQITSTYNRGEGSPKIARYRKGLQQLIHTIEGRPLLQLADISDLRAPRQHTRHPACVAASIPPQLRPCQTALYRRCN